MGVRAREPSLEGLDHRTEVRERAAQVFATPRDVAKVRLPIEDLRRLQPRPAQGGERATDAKGELRSFTAPKAVRDRLSHEFFVPQRAKGAVPARRPRDPEGQLAPRAGFPEKERLRLN